MTGSAARSSRLLPASVETVRHAVELVRRAFAEFLTIPTLLIAVFMALAAGSYWLDEVGFAQQDQNSGLFGSKLFSDPESIVGLLGAIASGIITVSSITFSLLLVAVQQGAASLTSVVYDQFLRRRTNQIYFGFFIGLSLYCLVILASVTPVHTPVLGVTIALVMTAGALFMLVLLIYTTVDQMRPASIVDAIHDHTLAARRRMKPLLDATRRCSREPDAEAKIVHAETSGYLSAVNVEKLAKALNKAGGGAEVAVSHSIGDFVAFGDAVAEIRFAPREGVEELEKAVLAALPIETARDLGGDPALGVEQLAIIAWTSASTAKSNPEPALFACRSLRDILARSLLDEPPGGPATAPVAVVYRDNFFDSIVEDYESLTVVASESMQHQTLAEIYLAVAALLPPSPPFLRRQFDAVVMRSLSALGDHVPTSELEAALSDLAEALDDVGHDACAAAVRSALMKLSATVGRFSARAGRFKGPDGE